MASSANDRPKHWRLSGTWKAWWIGIAIAVVVTPLLLLCLLLAAVGATWLGEAPLLVLCGWIPYGARVLAQLEGESAAFFRWILSIVIFALLLHFVARSFAPSWRLRRTLAIVALILAAATAGICLIGVGHQATWIAHSPQRLEFDNELSVLIDADNDLMANGDAAVQFCRKKGSLPRSTFSDDGRPLHNWMTMILPQIGRMDLFESVSFYGPWDMNYQYPVFDQEVGEFMRVGEFQRRDDRDFAVTHYSANKRVIDSSSIKSMDEIADGAGNTILVGEIRDAYPAWGRPRNGRDPAVGLNQPGGFGSPRENSVYFTMGDGSVRILSRDIDPEVLRALSTPRGEEPESLYQSLINRDPAKASEP